MLQLSLILFGACFQHMFVQLNVEHPRRAVISQAHTQVSVSSRSSRVVRVLLFRNSPIQSNVTLVKSLAFICLHVSHNLLNAF